jgi:hypothetical protein
MGRNEIGVETPEIADLLDEIRAAFDRQTGKQDAYRKIFDEFIEENDFYAALHVLCDYLMESENTKLDPSLVDKVRRVHDLMHIEDYCIEMLRAKIAPREQ